MATLITTAGLALEASGAAIVISELRAGRSVGATAGLFHASDGAILAATDIATPNTGGRRITQLNPVGRFEGPRAQTQFAPPAAATAYTISELGLFTADGTMYGYTTEGAEGLLTVQEGRTNLILFDRAFTNGTPGSTTFAQAFVLLPPAAGDSPGAVLLAGSASDDDRVPLVSLVKSLIQSMTTAISFASFVEINTGTINDKAIPPGQLARSNYREILASTRAPSASDGSDGDIWVEYTA